MWLSYACNEFGSVAKSSKKWVHSCLFWHGWPSCSLRAMDYTRIYSIIPYLYFIFTFDNLIIRTSCLLWTYFRFSEPNFLTPTGYYIIWASYPWAGSLMCVCSNLLEFDSMLLLLLLWGFLEFIINKAKCWLLTVQAIQCKRLKHCLFKFLRHRKGQWSVFWDMISLFLVENHPHQQDVQSFFENEVSFWRPLIS